MRAFAAGKSALRVEVLRGPFGMVLLALFSFHLAQFMPGPLMPLQWVQNLHFSDNDVAIGTAFFHGSVFFGSLQLARLTRRYGNHRITVVGAALLALYPLFTALMPNLFFYILTSIAGGQAWALVGGAMGNYLLEKVPAHDRPAYLAWYNIALNLAILLGTMLGPLLAAWFDIQTALILIFFLRLGAAGMLWIAEPRPPKAADDPRLAAQA
jgi:predicted MFS family arabinose efflux permease